MSAPPIGMISVTPSASEISTISQNSVTLPVVKNSSDAQRPAPTPSAMLIVWRCGSRIGLPDMRPSSFRKAMTEPVKVMAPIAAPSDISIRLAAWISPGMPMPKASRREEGGGGDQHGRETDQRVEEGDELRHLGHFDPLAPAPRRSRRRWRGPARSGRSCRSSTAGAGRSVVTMAMPMPIMPKRLPCCEVVGCDRPRSARMNSTPETR